MTTNVLQTTLKFLLVLALAMPIGLAIADDGDKKDGVVILKCAESIGIRFNADGQIVGTVPEEAAGFSPKVVMLEGTFDEPDSCGVPLGVPLAPCPECLRDLINISGCRAHIAFPGSPLVVHSSKKAIPGTNYSLFLSITEYVFQCHGGLLSPSVEDGYSTSDTNAPQ